MISDVFCVRSYTHHAKETQCLEARHARDNRDEVLRDAAVRQDHLQLLEAPRHFFGEERGRPQLAISRDLELAQRRQMVKHGAQQAVVQAAIACPAQLPQAGRVVERRENLLFQRLETLRRQPKRIDTKFYIRQDTHR